MIPFSPPRIDQKIIDEVVDTLQSGWITTGPKTLKFEDNLTEYCGNKATVCVSAATPGISLLLSWLGVGEGDEIIIPSYTYCATGNVVIHSGAKLVMVDVNEEDFNINIENIKAAVTARTKVIMPVDIGGFPCDYDEIYEFINSPEIKSQYSPKNEIQEKMGRIAVISDSAHSIGATYKGKKAGAIADISVFSFHAVKNLSTAEGGAIALNLPAPFDNEEVRKKLKTMTLHGQSKDAFSKMQVGAWRYDVIESGFKCNMTDIQASMGLVELDRYEGNLARRRAIMEAYHKGFENQPWAHLPVFENKNKTGSFHLYLFRIKNITEQQRDEIIQEISKHEVAVNVHYMPIPLLTAFKKNFDIKDFPQTYKNYSCEITLPVYFTLTDDQVQTVIDTVTKSVETVLNN
ncbi:MAG: DegT/DnrJ/EryC1/StrS aminotransferase family protein [Flavobacteriales bacterium]